MKLLFSLALTLSTWVISFALSLLTEEAFFQNKVLTEVMKNGLENSQLSVFLVPLIFAWILGILVPFLFDYLPSMRWIVVLFGASILMGWVLLVVAAHIYMEPPIFDVLSAASAGGLPLGVMVLYFYSLK